jgi:hypothetical protein
LYLVKIIEESLKLFSDGLHRTPPLNYNSLLLCPMKYNALSLCYHEL